MTSEIDRDSTQTDDGLLISQPQDERRQELARDIVGAAYLRGDFVLSSGVRSTYYFDKYLFETRPSILRRIASLCVELVPPTVDRIAGPELGAVALATALSLESGLPFVIVRKSGKDYGTNRLVEGELFAGESVLVIEDVISTGTQAINAAGQVARAGAEVAGILGIIDREQGGAANIAAAGYHFQALFTLSDLR
jgi:orotate phosphoribosyltransferase